MADNGYLTPEEVSKELRVSLSAIYKFLRNGDLVGVRVGDLWRIRRVDLEAFLKPNKAG